MRSAMIVGAVVGLWWVWPGGEQARAPRVQAGVLRDGFTVLVDREVHELARDGRATHRMTLSLADEVRLVGSSAGSTVGWRDGKQLKLAALEDDGTPGKTSSWGKRVTQLCEGAASNAQRFGVGWLEADGGVWVVHGPLGKLADAGLAAHELATQAKITWCGIASAGADLAMAWREGAKVTLNFCTPKACSPYLTKLAVPAGEPLLGFGCVRDRCLFASRDREDRVMLRRVVEGGRATAFPLAGADGDAVTVIGAGRAFAVAYLADDRRARVELRDLEGKVTQGWRFDEASTAALAWDGAHVLAAFPSGTFVVLE